jgi:hypothetical protein
MKAFVVVISGLLLAAPAVAQVNNGGTMSGSGASLSTGSSELAEGAAEEAGEGENRRICRRVETASGSRMSYRRLCMTARQWRDFNRNN